MSADSPDKRYAVAVHTIGHLRVVLDTLLRGKPIDVQGAYDATSWAHLEKIFAIPQSDLAAVDPHQALGRDALEAWLRRYPSSGQMELLATGDPRFKTDQP